MKLQNVTPETPIGTKVMMVSHEEFYDDTQHLCFRYLVWHGELVRYSGAGLYEVRCDGVPVMWPRYRVFVLPEGEDGK